MNNKKNWPYIAILTFAVAVIWLAVSANAQMRKVTVPPDLQKAVEPLDPNLNIQTLQKIKERAK